MSMSSEATPGDGDLAGGGSGFGLLFFFTLRPRLRFLVLGACLGACLWGSWRSGSLSVSSESVISWHWHFLLGGRRHRGGEVNCLLPCSLPAAKTADSLGGHARTGTLGKLVAEATNTAASRFSLVASAITRSNFSLNATTCHFSSFSAATLT